MEGPVGKLILIFIRKLIQDNIALALVENRKNFPTWVFRELLPGWTIEEQVCTPKPLVMLNRDRKYIQIKNPRRVESLGSGQDLYDEMLSAGVCSTYVRVCV